MSNLVSVTACTITSCQGEEGDCAAVGLQVRFSNGEVRTNPDLGGDGGAVGRFAGRLVGQTFPPDVLGELVTDYLEERYGG